MWVFFVAGIVGRLAGAPPISLGLLTCWGLAPFLEWSQLSLWWSVEILGLLFVFLQRSHTYPYKGSHLGSPFCLLILGPGLILNLDSGTLGVYKQSPTEKIRVHCHLFGCWAHYYFVEFHFKAGKGRAAAQNLESLSHPAQSWGFCQPRLLSCYYSIGWGGKSYLASLFLSRG